MTADCADVMKAFERHVKSSHALGKFVVESVLGRVRSTFFHHTDNGRVQAAVTVTDPVESASSAAPITGLPVDESEFALLTSAEVVNLISRSTDVQVRAIGEYERSHRRRRLVLEAVATRVGQSR